MPLTAEKARKEVNKRRRHFNMSKTGFVSQIANDAAKTNPRDVLVDESKQADIENLGDCLRALGDGQSLGDFSLTIVLYGKSKSELDQLIGITLEYNEKIAPALGVSYWGKIVLPPGQSKAEEFTTLVHDHHCLRQTRRRQPRSAP
jgi:hypothetical protein